MFLPGPYMLWWPALRASHPLRTPEAEEPDNPRARKIRQYELPTDREVWLWHPLLRVRVEDG